MLWIVLKRKTNQQNNVLIDAVVTHITDIAL